MTRILHDSYTDGVPERKSRGDGPYKKKVYNYIHGVERAQWRFFSQRLSLGGTEVGGVVYVLT